MENPTNFLLGYGERLTKTVNPPGGGGPKVPPYTFDQAKARLLPMAEQTSCALDTLPPLACPSDMAVAKLTLHPQYIAKSYFPSGLIREAGFNPLGSRPDQIVPERWTRKGAPQLVGTTTLFVEGPRRQFRELPARLAALTEDARVASEIVAVEKLAAYEAAEKIAKERISGKLPVMEIVLHASANTRFVIDGFEAFARELGIDMSVDDRFYVGSLCFLPARLPREQLRKIAEFAYVRFLREMPKLRTLRPQAPRKIHSFPCVLPDADCISEEPRMAIFDGGLRDTSVLARWATPIDPPGVGAPLDEYLDHGHSVTSAALFGPVQNGNEIGRPFCRVHHYRVLDDISHQDPYELYSVLKRIRTVLETNRYELVNLSIGPELAIDDHEVHGWTAYLDSLLANGRTLATVAAGNGGELDAASGNSRVQVPGDCVNALTVGAADCDDPAWRRASYSSYGPGRSPGLVKPDVVVFGGSDRSPFGIVSADGKNSRGTQGTSFASPALLRLAAGLRGYLGGTPTALALKALLVHCADDETENRIEHGWGRVPLDINNIIICPGNSARVLYQGYLSPAEYLRAQIPIPVDTLAGMVNLRATFCFMTETDPQDPGNYTRSGLEVTFRPHAEKRKKGAEHASSAPFFQLKAFSAEDELRLDAHKWETTLHREVTKFGSSLKDPVFDIHYNARAGGALTNAAKKIPYALVVTVSAPKVPDIYNKIVRRYATLLQPLRPVLPIQIRS